MDQPTLDSTAAAAAKVFVRELTDGARVESPFLVRDVARRQKRNGDSFLKLQLGDVTGALLHDIGKVEAYAMEGGAIELTDLGKLQGEIPLGYYAVRREIEEMPDFPRERAEGLLHIILSHHGQLEHGSPVVPCTREATLVHMIDNLGGRLGSFDRLEKALPDGSRWSGYDRGISGSAFFASRRATPHAREGETP